MWREGLDVSPPLAADASRQKAWDAPRVAASFKALQEATQDTSAQARLLAASRKESESCATLFYFGKKLNLYQFQCGWPLSFWASMFSICMLYISCAAFLFSQKRSNASSVLMSKSVWQVLALHFVGLFDAVRRVPVAAYLLSVCFNNCSPKTSPNWKSK